MNDIYITPFDRAKLNFAAFTSTLFENEKALNSFAISFFHQRQIIQGKIECSNYVSEITELSFISYEMENINSLNHQFNDIMSCLFSKVKLNHHYINENLIFSENVFNPHEKHIIESLIINKNLLFPFNLHPYNHQIHYFNKSSLDLDIKKFLGHDLLIKQQANFLDNILCENNLCETIKFKI